MYTDEELDAPGCHGFGTRREQFAERAAFIAKVNAAATLQELQTLATEVPSLVHNVSVLPAAIAVEERAQLLAPIDGGYRITHDGELLSRACLNRQ